MSHGSKPTYVCLFKDLRKALEDEFGDIGVAKTVMFDFEVAALSAVEEVFPEWTIRTCYFHFLNNIKRQIKKKGIKDVASGSKAFKKWISEIMGKLRTFRF